MVNPRNAYQNYAAATNSTDRALHTYMGSLLPRRGNVNYSTSGELSPLLNDPYLRTIGVGTRVFLAGAQGFVSWRGTQYNTTKPRNERGVPESNAATLMLTGDLKEMSTDYLRAAYFEKYGVTLYLGIGIPFPCSTKRWLQPCPSAIGTSPSWSAITASTATRPLQGRTTSGCAPARSSSTARKCGPPRSRASKRLGRSPSC